MATITATDMTGAGDNAITTTTLDGLSDSFTYNPGKRPVLILTNDTGAAITPTIDGDGASTVDVPGTDGFDISAGFALSEIGVGASVAINLRSIGRYLAGDIAITAGSGLDAQLLEF